MKCARYAGAMLLALMGAISGAKATSQAPGCIAVVGTSDLHGALVLKTRGQGVSQTAGHGLPVLGGYVRQLRRQYGPRLLLVDAGDQYQGTLASNLSQGAAMIAGLNAMGYQAATLGNHDFDFGPVPGGSDPQGALKARIAEANFPFLSSNILNQRRQTPIAWPNLQPHRLLDVDGVRVGILGVSTLQTPDVVARQHIEGLHFAPAAPQVRAEAQRLRAMGAQIVVLLAHMGGRCTRLDDALDLTSCSTSGLNAELFNLLHALPTGTVDVAIGGHTHQRLGHWVNGTAALQSGISGEHLGWVDACVRPKGGIDPSRSTIHTPIPTCLRHRGGQGCHDGDGPVRQALFLGAPVEPDPAVERAIAPYLERVRLLGRRSLGAHLPQPIDARSLATLTAEAMRRDTQADFGLQNRGAVRAGLPAGPVTYQGVFEVMPYDNRAVRVEMSGRQLEHLLRRLHGPGAAAWGGPSLSGLQVLRGAHGLHVLTARGKRLDPDARYTLAVNEFIYQGGDNTHDLFGQISPAQASFSKENARDLLARFLSQLYAAPQRPLRAQHARAPDPS